MHNPFGWNEISLNQSIVVIAGMTMEDIRTYEKEMHEKTNEKVGIANVPTSDPSSPTTPTNTPTDLTAAAAAAAAGETTNL